MHIFIRNIFFKIFSLICIIVLIFLAQVSFLNQAAKWGMNGGDDWGFLFYYDANKGNELGNFRRNINDLSTPYYWTEVYYIGPLKQFFGLNQAAFKQVELLFKSLAVLSVAFLVFKLTRDKLFAFLVIFFFIIFPSTAGVLSHIVLSGGYLTIAFMCVSILFYIKSAKNEKKILLAGLFFYLALLACPPRAYLLIPVPFFVELIRLKMRFRPSVFLRRILVFYLIPILTLQSGPGWFEPQKEIFVRIKQIMWGNLYTLSLPFQAVSTLFIDQSILKDILGKSLLRGFLMLNIALLILSIFLGFFIKGKEKMWAFATWIIIYTLLLEATFYFLGLLSIRNGTIPFLDPEGRPYLLETLNPTFFQASLGGYFLIIGLALGFEWWRYQRDNKILTVIVFGWLWAFISELLLYLTNSWWNMITESNDKYILVCSVGAVIFTAGIFTLSFKALGKIKNVGIRGLSISILLAIILLIAWKDYKLLDQFYYNWNEGEGGSSYWQDTMYQRFLEKFGKDNLKKPILLYIDSRGKIFNTGSFANTIRYRIYYDESGNLIRDNCKKIIHNDTEILKKAYEIQSGEKGFIFDSECVAPQMSTIGRTVFYPLSNFYAYKMENRDFVDIKDKIINELDQ